MKNVLIFCTVLLFAALSSCTSPASVNDSNSTEMMMKPDRVLRHVVVFKFKETASEADVEAVNKSFAGLQNDIPEIKDFEWGLNNSPEGLDQEFTHVYTVTFHSEEDRETYLPHPAHQAFVEQIGPVIDKVFVVDYWTE